MGTTDGPVSPTHVPVLRDRVVELLAPALADAGSVYVDCTLGLGGHAAAVLAACPHARLVGIDRDDEALAVARDRLAPYADRVTLVRAVYHELADVLAGLGLDRVQAVLADLGLSSLQIDRTERGFAYRTDAPLDMRMSADGPLTARDVVNTYDVRDLARVISRYGEERFADRIARAVVANRPYDSSARLVETIAGAVPAAARRSGSHPAKRTFQALRIEVNAELDSLTLALPRALAALALGGRIAVLSYHSLEDRLVKQTFARGATDRVPPDLPVVPPGYGPELRLLTHGAERPTPDEVAANPRAASARLRAAVRVEEAA